MVVGVCMGQEWKQVQVEVEVCRLQLEEEVEVAALVEQGYSWAAW